MGVIRLKIERTNTNNLKIEELPDGSKMIIDASQNTILALNATAGAAVRKVMPLHRATEA